MKIRAQIDSVLEKILIIIVTDGHQRLVASFFSLFIG